VGDPTHKVAAPGLPADALPGGLPADALVILVGPSGAGKSTWAAARFASGFVLASDAFRALVSGDAGDQGATADAFKVLHMVAKARLRRGLLTVVDATNLTVAARRTLRRLAAGAGRPAVAVVFDISLGRCIAQNAARAERRVPEQVVRRHHVQLAETLGVLQREGYHRIVRLDDEDIMAA
jgi:predicted kinase